MHAHRGRGVLVLHILHCWALTSHVSVVIAGHSQVMCLSLLLKTSDVTCCKRIASLQPALQKVSSGAEPG